MDLHTNSISIWFSHIEEEEGTSSVSVGMDVLRDMGLQGTPQTARLETLLANDMFSAVDEASTLAHQTTFVSIEAARKKTVLTTGS